MARGRAPVVADRVAPPPMFSVPPPPPPMFVAPPPMFSVPPPPTPPRFSISAPPPRFSIASPPNFTPKPPPNFTPPPMFTPPMFTQPIKPETKETKPEDSFTDGGESVDNGGSSGGDSLTPTPITTPTPTPTPVTTPKIKVAPIDTVLFNDDAVPKEIIADLLFENIGGQEILTIARHDTVNGQTVLYQPIKNINILQQQYNPNNLLRLRNTTNTIFDNFTINLFNKIPQIGSGSGGSNIYLDPNSGDLIIELVNLSPDELVEVQITSSGTIEEAG